MPDPEILRQPHEHPPRAIERRRMTGATDPDPAKASLSTPSPAVRSEIQVFEKKKIFLAKDLGVGCHLRNALENIITSSGGSLTNQVRKADMFICKFREGEDYRLASRTGRDVGNLAWLYYLITNNSWTSPTRRLLHYPIARHGLPGFKDLRISLSNYSGEARVYLENLIIAAGAECTKTLKQDNTHLVTAHVVSEKCAAAKDWGIHLVNHLWLEESYAKWKIQSLTDPRYTHFPSRTNLGEVVGQTKIDRDALERNFFAEDVGTEEGPEPDRPMKPKNGNLVPSLAPQNNALPSSRTIGGYTACNTNEIWQTPKGMKDVRKLGRPAKPRTPGPKSFAATGKENEVPSTTSRRKTKEAAVTRLQIIAPDIALYEKEKKRVGGVVYGGVRKNGEGRSVQERKRSAEADSDSESNENNEPKRVKTGLPPPSMHLLVSGYKKWVGQARAEDSDKVICFPCLALKKSCLTTLQRHLRSLGVIVTQDPARATHLAAPGVLRTHKFVAALAFAPNIISTDFIDAALGKETLPDPDKFILKDEANEQKYGVSISLSRERAKQNRNQLLHGRTIYCTADIHGGFEAFKSIVVANGGQCILFHGRAPGMRVPSSRADSEVSLSLTDEEMQNEVQLLSGPGKENHKDWAKFKAMAESSRKIPRIVRTDWLLETAMTQKVAPVGKHEILEAMEA